MEITIDRNTLYITLLLVAALAFLGLAALGRSFSPVNEAGEVRILSWSDWKLAKAEKRFDVERMVLRQDVDELAALLNGNPDPVAAQLLAQRIGQHAAAGESILQPARVAVMQAAQDVASWSAGALDRDTAIASLEASTALLK